MELETIKKEKPPKKFVGGKRETAKEKREEDNRPPRLRRRSYLFAWKFDLSVLQKAISAQNVEVGWGV